jgi:hypothetical protein
VVEGHLRRLVLAATAALVLLGSCRGGCQRLVGKRDALEETLGRLPADARFVAHVDVAKVRATPFWARLSALAEDSPEDKKRIDALSARTGLDPLKQIHRVTAGFPDNARESGRYALLIDGEGFDERRLVAYARDEAALRGAKIEQRSEHGHTLWASTGPDRVAGFFTGPGHFLLGAGGWGETMAALASGARGATAADNAELIHLCRRIDAHRALWFAALVPVDLRQMLLADPKHDHAASVTRMAAALDLGPGLTAELVADLSNAGDARALVERIQATVREAKRNAAVLMLGLGPYLDALDARADGPTLRVSISLAEPQVTDLLDRLGALARSAREKSNPK